MYRDHTTFLSVVVDVIRDGGSARVPTSCAPVPSSLVFPSGGVEAMMEHSSFHVDGHDPQFFARVRSFCHV